MQTKDHLTVHMYTLYSLRMYKSKQNPKLECGSINEVIDGEISGVNDGPMHKVISGRLTTIYLYNSGFIIRNLRYLYDTLPLVPY